MKRIIRYRPNGNGDTETWEGYPVFKWNNVDPETKRLDIFDKAKGSRGRQLLRTILFGEGGHVIVETQEGNILESYDF